MKLGQVGPPFAIATIACSIVTLAYQSSLSEGFTEAQSISHEGKSCSVPKL